MKPAGTGAETMCRFLALAACLAAGCSGRSGGDPPQPPEGAPPGSPPDRPLVTVVPPPAPRDESLGVYETVLRFRLQNYPPDVRAFVSVADKDPPPELLERLRKDWPNLRPASADPRKEGLSVYAGEVRWEQGKAVVLAGYSFPTKYAGEAYFADHHVAREGARWVVKAVTDETMT